MNRSPLHALPAFVLLLAAAAPNTVRADEACESAFRELGSSKRALRECLEDGRPCLEEFRRRDAADASVAPCIETPEPEEDESRAEPVELRHTEIRLHGRRPPTRPHRELEPGAAPLFYDLDVLLANKTLREEWGRLETQVEGGILLTAGHVEWPVFAAADLLTSEAEAGGLRGTTTEIAFGVRRTFRRGWQVPKIGGGICIIQASWDRPILGEPPLHDTNSAMGLWFGGSALLRFGSRVNVGIHARWSTARVDLAGTSVDAGGLHFGATLGIGGGAAVFRP